jgi:transposase
MDTSTHTAAKRRHRSAEEKQRILAEATAPGASVAAVARRYGVNANLVFGWLRLRKAGLLEKAAVPAPLLPVKVTMPTVLPDRASRPTPRARSVRGDPAGHVVVEFPGGISVRVHGRVDPEALTAVFAVLRAR